MEFSLTSASDAKMTLVKHAALCTQSFCRGMCGPLRPQHDDNPALNKIADLGQPRMHATERAFKRSTSCSAGMVVLVFIGLLVGGLSIRQTVG